MLTAVRKAGDMTLFRASGAAMKFTWFNLMPWPHLPDDFREKYRSVWVDIPSSLYDPVKGHELYNIYLDELEYAETLGYDGIGVNEHHANAYGMMPSPNIMAAALARRTSRAALVVLGNSIALYNPPIRVAEEFAMLDVISGGRLLAGFPVGTSMDTNYVYGDIPALTRERYAEAHELIMRAWREPEPFAFNGRYTKLRYANCWPKPDSVAAADLHSWRRLTGNLRLLSRLRLRLLLPELRRLQARETADGRLLAAGEGPRQGSIALSRRDSRRRSSSPNPTRKPSAIIASTSTTSTTAVCTCTRVSPMLPAIGRSKR